jgi:putative tryptophan/tyrosine transport system substrate-binding protein
MKHVKGVLCLAATTEWTRKSNERNLLLVERRVPIRSRYEHDTCEVIGMRRRDLVANLLVATATPLPRRVIAQAKQVRIPARIAVFFSGSPQTAFERTWGRSFVAALREFGWVEGANLELEWWYSEDQAERRRVLAEDFVRRKLDVIVVQSTTETVAMKHATTTIPVVMVLIGDPVGAGLVQSLSRPGGNITGTSLMSSDTFGKGIEFLKELVPQARRVAVLGNPDNASVVRVWAETRAAATQLGIELLSAEARSRDELATAFAAIVRERPDALVVLLDSLTVDNRQQIVEFAATHRLPAQYGGPMFAELGGLLVYTVDFHELWRRAAVYVDRILKGAKPADLPVEQPTKFNLVINRKTADALGLTVPASILARADEVIE